MLVFLITSFCTDEMPKTTTSASDDHTIITETPLTSKNSSSVLSTGCDAPPQETVKHDAANIEMPMPAAGAGDEHQDDAEALINLNRDGERSSCSEDARSSSDAESFDMMDNCSSQSSDGMEKVEDAELLTVSDQDEERETAQGSDHGDDSGLYDTSLQEATVSMTEGTSSSTEQRENGELIRLESSSPVTMILKCFVDLKTVVALFAFQIQKHYVTLLRY